jgi:hypothetical protein
MTEDQLNTAVATIRHLEERFGGAWTDDQPNTYQFFMGVRQGYLRAIREMFGVTEWERVISTTDLSRPVATNMEEE